MLKLLKSSYNQYLFLLIILIAFVALRYPSLFEPYWYGDEGIYQVLGRGIRNNLVLYKEIWDNKPPLLYIFYAVVNSDQFYIRYMSLIFGIGSVLSFYFLTTKLLKSNIVIIISTLLFAYLFSIPSLEANIANAENFILFFSISAGLIVYKVSENNIDKKIKNNYMLTAGTILGVAFLLKIVALFDFVAFGLFLLFINKQSFIKSSLDLTKDYYLYIVGFISPFIITLLYFSYKFALDDYIGAIILGNISYVGYKNELFFPQSLLIIKTGILVLALFILYRLRRLIKKNAMLIYIWFLLSMYSALFSHRDYPHYMLLALPSLCLIFGLIFDSKKHRIQNLIIFIVTIVILNYTFGPLSIRSIFYSKPLNYYKNYLDYVFGKKSTEEYQRFFDPDVPNTYALVDYLNTQKINKIFIWSNSPQVYTLTNQLPVGRFTVAYHIEDDINRRSETLKAIAVQKPDLIIVMPDASNIKIPLENYSYRSTIYRSDIYERKIP